MAVEFGCGECGKLLRVPDDAAGKQARCPACGGIQHVPLAKPNNVEPPYETSPRHRQPIDDPFAEGESVESTTDKDAVKSTVNPYSPSDGNPFAEPDALSGDSPFAEEGQNPYQTPASGIPPTSPSMFAGPNRDWVRLVVEGPANSLAAVSGVVIFFSLIGIAINLLQAVNGGDVEHLVLTSVGRLLLLLPYGIVVYGATQMKQLKSYNLSITASIIAMMPCSGCCIIGLPVGIWSLVVLLKPEVRSAFR